MGIESRKGSTGHASTWEYGGGYSVPSLPCRNEASFITIESVGSTEDASLIVAASSLKGKFPKYKSADIFTASMFQVN